jgi:hypothetical protein
VPPKVTGKVRMKREGATKSNKKGKDEIRGEGTGGRGVE